jgi:hypothetical protein
MVVDAAEVICKTGNCLLGRAAIRGKLIQVGLFQLFLTERRQPLPIPFVLRPFAPLSQSDALGLTLSLVLLAPVFADRSPPAPTPRS